MGVIGSGDLMDAPVGAPEGERALRVIVAGYPKSGNTWLSHLVADLLGCAMAGFWRSRRYESSFEPPDRPRIFPDHLVYKSHHFPAQLGLNASTEPDLKVIHVVRDPRDVVCSGGPYFNKLMPRFQELNPEVFHLDPLEAMAHALLEGTRAFPFCSVPWSDYNRQFTEIGVFCIRYEDVRSNPSLEAERILAYLGVRRERPHILAAIKRQSFQAVKARGDVARLPLLRRGQAGSHRSELPIILRSRIEKGCAEMMGLFGYEPSIAHSAEVASALEALRPVSSPAPLKRLGSSADDYVLIPDDLDGVNHWVSPPEFRPSQSMVNHLRVDHRIEAVNWPPGLPCILHCDAEHFSPECVALARIVILDLEELTLCLDPESFASRLGKVLRALASDFACVHLRCHRDGSPLAVPGVDPLLPSALQATFLRRDRWGQDSSLFAPALPHPLELVPERGAHPQRILDPRWCSDGQQSSESLLKTAEYRISFLRGRRSVDGAAAPSKEANWIYNCYRKKTFSCRAKELSPESFQEARGDLTELAIGKPFSLSAAHKSYPAEGVVSNRDPFFFHTAKMRWSAITIDLLESCELHCLVVCNRSDAFQERAHLLFYVVHSERDYAREDGTPLQGTWRAFRMADPSPSVTDLAGEQGRYLTIFSPAVTHLHFSSIEIFGKRMVSPGGTKLAATPSIASDSEASGR